MRLVRRPRQVREADEHHVHAALGGRLPQPLQIHAHPRGTSTPLAPPSGPAQSASPKRAPAAPGSADSGLRKRRTRRDAGSRAAPTRISLAGFGGITYVAAGAASSRPGSHSADPKAHTPAHADRWHHGE